MNFFKKLLLKLEKKADQRKASRMEKTGSTVAEFTDKIFTQAPPKAPQQQAPSAPSPVPVGPAPVPRVYPPIDANGQDYLRRYQDVAGHVDPDVTKVSYSKDPYQHYLDHGKAEGRIWGTPMITEADAVQGVVAPRGHMMPQPRPEYGLFMGYMNVVAKFIKREADWNRISGTLFQGSDHLVPKRIPYPDGYRAYKEDLNNWPEMAENFWYPEHIQEPDPGWQKVYERMAQERQAAQKPPVPPSTPEQTEIPL